MPHIAPRSLLRASLLATFVGLVACSGASQEPTDPAPPAGNPPRTSEPAPAPPLGGGATPAQPGAPSDAKPQGPASPADPGKPADPGDPNVDPGPIPNAGTKCVAGSMAEAEPNDAADQASVLGQPGSVCGQLAVGDVDFIRFTLPADATTIKLGGVTTQVGYAMTLEVDGQSMPLEGTVPFKPGMDYLVKVTNTGQAELDWRVDVSYQ